MRNIKDMIDNNEMPSVLLADIVESFMFLLAIDMLEDAKDKMSDAKEYNALAKLYHMNDLQDTLIETYDIYEKQSE